MLYNEAPDAVIPDVDPAHAHRLERRDPRIDPCTATDGLSVFKATCRTSAGVGHEGLLRAGGDLAVHFTAAEPARASGPISGSHREEFVTNHLPVRRARSGVRGVLRSRIHFGFPVP